MAITDAMIRQAKPTEKEYKLTESHGLFLLVKPIGSKSWRYRYSFKGRERLMTLGKYPVVSLSEARSRHLAARQLLESGIDPMEVRKAEKAEAKLENPFREVAELWMQHWKEGKSERHVETTRRRLEANVFPSLGMRPIAEIDPPEIVATVKGIEARGVSDLAKRALETIGQIFRYAIANGYAKNNPAAAIKPSDILKATKKVNMARVEAAELAGLLRAMDVYQGKPVTRLAMRLMALTFVRTSELIRARWDEIDTEARRWNIPAERMKMKTPHIVPLSRQALEVLELLRQVSGNGPLIFPGERSAIKPMSNNTILKALERMGYKGEMTGHGFRGLASTILHEQGYNHEHIELQLAHSPRNAVSASYNHALYLAPRTQMMQDWADYLETTQRGKVLPFAQGAA